MTTIGTVRLATVLGLGILMAGVTGCIKEEGPMERAGKKIDQAGEKTGQKIDNAVDKTGETIKKAGDAVKKSVK